MKETRGLLLGPFPPPIGGDTVMTNNLFRSRFWGEHGILLERIDTSPGATVRLPGSRLSGRDLLRGARIYLEFLVRLPRADFVLVWGNSRFIMTLGLFIIAACRISRKPVFVKVFGAFLGKRIARLPLVPQEIVLFVLARATRILPETQSLVRELVQDLRLPGERVVHLPNFLPDVAFREDFTPRSFSGRCVFFGQVKREKGVFDIIDALRGRPGLKCDFYGPLVERDRDAFLAEVSKSESLGYRGVLAPEKVPDAMRGYDVLLLPTYHQGEGYPAVILEAFAVGIPVIASRWLAIPEIVEDGVRGILVPPQSPHKVRDALDRLSGDARAYENFSRNGFDFVRSFSEKAVIEGILIAKVEGVLASGAARRGAVRPGGAGPAGA